MKSFNDTIKKRTEIAHSINLLKIIISSIEAYPEFARTLKVSKLDGEYLNSEVEQINKTFHEDHKKVNISCITELKNNIYKLEELMKLSLDKRLDYNIEKRINYLDLKGIKKMYDQEKKFKQKQIANQKLIIKSFLEQLDNSLPLYLKLEKKDNNYILTEILNNKITLKEIFKEISIDNIIDDLKLEDYEYYYYNELGSDPLDNSYKELYIYDTKEENLKKLKAIYPNIIIAEKLTKITKDKENKLIKSTIEVSELLLKIHQLQNLKGFLRKKEYNFTIDYIDKLIINIEEKIERLKNKIKKKITQEISKINIKESLENNVTSVIELIRLIIEVTNAEAKKQFNYDLQEINYREIIKPELINYQQILLKENYNIIIPIYELQELISKKSDLNDKSNKKNISKHTKKLLKKLIRKNKKS